METQMNLVLIPFNFLLQVYLNGFWQDVEVFGSLEEAEENARSMRNICPQKEYRLMAKVVN
jgi:hypothetical protein